MTIRLKTPTPKRILVANRGEIASRVARACQELGHTVVGIWTDNEINAGHLRSCNEWVHLPGTTNTETYLNIETLVKIAVENNIDGVHAGYGFLSENADFAQSLENANIKFIGPNINAIRIMGDKATSKALAKKVGVPVIPGTTKAVTDVEEALAVAKDIGYPVLLKAVAGGGGKGMRPCHNPDEVKNLFEIVVREAISSFGNGDILVEKLILNPRHIEVQILADQKGNIYHFFERECSIQRRHQKIIEEAPSPFIGEDEELRQNVCQTAVKLARAVNYDSAGTVEFVMAEDKSFYFLEMNTRIQVEHPITEEITGIDLIVCMIQAAFKDDLQINHQNFITRTGHAIECRICAEDPISMLPSPGLVTGFDTHFPQGTRFDHCIYRDLEITPDFDPMVGKLVVKGVVRDVAIRKMRAALNGLHIEGLKTNIPLHKIILEDKDFCDGNYSTNFIEEKKPQEKIDISVDYISIYKKLAVIEAKRIGM